ncbi:hypothetical protein [uncultured Streptomyces sp.]|uniref:hypothetical protein n=1 Tax=uncultured Streptomyces sp. TaxID=174707 RepID=UPI002628A367|nr:hypothetical protein [uncultured Streptomyces sp.]
MTYDRLVCANCAAPVSEGRCPACRASRRHLEELDRREGGPLGGLNPMMLIALLVVLVGALAVLAQHAA